MPGPILECWGIEWSTNCAAYFSVSGSVWQVMGQAKNTLPGEDQRRLGSKTVPGHIVQFWTCLGDILSSESSLGWETGKKTWCGSFLVPEVFAKDSSRSLS